MNKENESTKAVQLRRHKTIATGLFVLMAAIYIFSTWWLKTNNAVWLGYIKAFAEAAMVGALADWFAVTALFHYPMGIRIPHTNLIETRKKSIGDNLGGFIVDNFLTTAAIRPYIQQLNPSSLLTQWLGKEKNLNLLITGATRVLKEVIRKADDTSVTRFIAGQSAELLKNAKLNEVLASGLEMVTERGDQARMLDYLLKKLRGYVLDNEEMIKERVKKESHFLIPEFVDNIIASKITSGFAKYLAEIENNPRHNIRQDIDRQLAVIISEIRTNPKWQEELGQIKDRILSGDKIQQYAASVWKQVQTGILRDLEGQQSHIQLYLAKTTGEIVANLQRDGQMQHKFNHWARYHAYKYILRNRKKAGNLISDTVGNWQGRELSSKLELEVGKDLQFIRINGTLVGGLVGLIIYTVTRLIENG